MTAQRVGFAIGFAAIATTLLIPAPAGMPPQAWIVAGLVVWMASWWMTEAIPLTATALLPFLVLPFRRDHGCGRRGERVLFPHPVPVCWAVRSSRWR